MPKSLFGVVITMRIAMAGRVCLILVDYLRPDRDFHVSMISFSAIVDELVTNLDRMNRTHGKE